MWKKECGRGCPEDGGWSEPLPGRKRNITFLIDTRDRD